MNCIPIIRLGLEHFRQIVLNLQGIQSTVRCVLPVASHSLVLNSCARLDLAFSPLLLFIFGINKLDETCNMKQQTMNTKIGSLLAPSHINQDARYLGR